MSDTELYDAAGAVLAAGVDLLGALGAAPVAYVSHGDPAADCDQLTVQWTGFSVAPLGGPGAKAADAMDRRMPRLLTFDFALARWACVPAVSENTGTGNLVLPTPTAMDESAKRLATEAWVVFNGLRDLARRAVILGDVCRLAVVNAGRPLPPNGALGGWYISGTAELAGGGTTAPSGTGEP